jgi:SAM-dependent methyltransferase
MRRPYRFLDVACGDSSASARALTGTPIEHYYGIDISGPALAIARQELSVIRCPVTLEESDLVDALKRWTKPVDFVWVGQSLHHLETTAKRAFVQSVRRILNEDGLFLIWEPTLLDREAQEGWISRFESGSRPLWSNLTDEDWEAMLSHVRASDRPETSTTWRQFGLDAGFKNAVEIYISPTQLACVYCFDSASN